MQKSLNGSSLRCTDVTKTGVFVSLNEETAVFLIRLVKQHTFEPYPKTLQSEKSDTILSFNRK